MRETREIAMEETVPKRQSTSNTPLRALRAVGTSLLLVLLFAGNALAQAIAVTGTVSGSGGQPLSGVTVRISGTETRVQTNATGRYTITAPANGALTFTLIGQKPVREDIGGRTRIDVKMEGVTYLEEVVVTAYTEQRRADITGAVASINTESAARQTSASVLQKLDVVPGITVAASGSPGARSTVRIRGISSFQNNDPLYVVDGVPLQDSYINWLNPSDITSIQVLKDASASSIYGSRASNGVIVIETTRRGVTGAPKVTASVRTGIASPTRGYDDFLITDALDYFKVIKASYENAGLAVPTNIYGDPNNPTVPAYIYAVDDAVTARDAFGRPTAVDLTKYSYPNSLIMPGSAGTNWWDAVFGTGAVSDYNVNVAGGSSENTYSVSGNYFNQAGTAAYNRFRRGTLRANTSFTRGKISLGENVAIAAERAFGGLGSDASGETGLLGKNILSQPVVPVYDVNGNFASGKSTTLGNNTNPLKSAFEARNNLSKNNRVFGNVFAGYALNPAISFRSSLGFTGTQGNGVNYSPPTPENSEPTSGNTWSENQNTGTDWTWSNTARFNKTLSQHTFNVLLGQEANQGRYRELNGSITNLINTGLDSRYIQDALGQTKNTSSNGSQSSLLSYFGKADYNFADKYVASFTVRRDGSSRLGPDHRWGTFPAVGLGWHVTKEPFLEGNHFLSDLNLRVGWGVTGNQNIPSGRINPQFGGNVQETYYAIDGGDAVTPGYRQTILGNPDLKWEENRSTNVGADVALWDGAVNLVVDVYRRNTNNLLYNPGLPATAGVASAPIVNIGKMKNTGIDFSIGHQGTWWNASFQGTHYKNEIVAINGDQLSFAGDNGTRLPGSGPIINQIGYPISSFYGYQVVGIFQNDAEVAASAAQNGKPGRLKFADLNGDNVIDADDRTIIGNPHPDFTGALDLGFRRGNFDLSGTFFGSFGNDIFDAQKDFYIFRDFSTTVVKDRLANSWSPTNPNAKYPIVQEGDTHSREISSFYVEDGSYVRLRNLQLGYTVPQSLARWVSAARIYVQAENLFTITGYEGLDPSLPLPDNTANGADTRDQYRGVDRGAYPSNRIFSIGLTTSF